MGNNVVGELAQQRVGGDTGETVGAATFQPEFQFAEFARSAGVVLHPGQQLFQVFNAGADFIVMLLADHKANPLGIKVAEGLFERRDLVVLATQTYHQNPAGVGVANHVLQNGTGILVILAQLGTAVLMTEQMNAINRRQIAFALDLLQHLLGHGIHATHCW